MIEVFGHTLYHGTNRVGHCTCMIWNFKFNKRNIAQQQVDTVEPQQIMMCNNSIFVVIIMGIHCMIMCWDCEGIPSNFINEFSTVSDNVLHVIMNLKPNQLSNDPV